METLGERIRRLRLRHGFTLQQLATRCGVSNVAVHHWEAGSRSPLACNIRPLARALRISVEMLLTGHEDPHTAALHAAIRANAPRERLLAMVERSDV